MKTFAALSLSLAMILSTSSSFASVLNCKTSVARGGEAEGDDIVDNQTTNIATTPMVMADLELKPMHGYTLSASVRATSVTIYAEGNGVRLAMTGENSADVTIGSQSSLTDVFVTHCEIK